MALCEVKNLIKHSMLKDNTSLSICIPTFNRPKAFKRFLSRLLPQIDSRVEIVIRDDSPNDDTKKIFYSLIEDINISHKYFHDSKIGLDAAVLFLLENASGDYVWFFGDDDELLDGGIKAVLNLMDNNNDLNFIWANFALSDKSNLAVNRSNGFFESQDDMLESLAHDICLLSTQVVKRKVALKGLERAQKHIHGFAFASTAIVLYAATEPGRSYFLRGPFVLCNPTSMDEIKSKTTQGGVINNDGFITYGIYFFELMKDFNDRFSRKSIRKTLNGNFACLWRGILVGWVGGWDTPKGKRIQMLKYYWSYPECWVAFSIMLLPRWMVIAFYKFYKIFYSQRKFTFLKK